MEIGFQNTSGYGPDVDRWVIDIGDELHSSLQYMATYHDIAADVLLAAIVEHLLTEDSLRLNGICDYLSSDQEAYANLLESLEIGAEYLHRTCSAMLREYNLRGTGAQCIVLAAFTRKKTNDAEVIIRDH